MNPFNNEWRTFLFRRMKMPKILRVYHEGDKCNPEFASRWVKKSTLHAEWINFKSCFRRQLFLDVDPYLRMVMYLGDVNSSCYFVGTENIQASFFDQSDHLSSQSLAFSSCRDNTIIFRIINEVNQTDFQRQSTKSEMRLSKSTNPCHLMR